VVVGMRICVLRGQIVQGCTLVSCCDVLQLGALITICASVTACLCLLMSSRAALHCAASWHLIHAHIWLAWQLTHITQLRRLAWRLICWLAWQYWLTS